MPHSARPPLLVDTGAFVAQYKPGDPWRREMHAFLEAQDAEPTFGRWVTVEGVVAESYTLLRRRAGLGSARAFLADLAASRLVVMPVPWADVARFLVQEPQGKLGASVSFTDASLVVAARQLRARHVLTSNPGDFRPFALQPVP